MHAIQTGVLFLSLSGSGDRGNLSMSLSKVYQQCWKEWAGWYVSQSVCQTLPPLTPKLANFLVHLFQGWPGLAHTWYISFCYFCYLFGASSWLHKASNHPVISKLKHHFYVYSILLLVNVLILAMLNVCYLLLEIWAPASSLTTFKLAWKTATLLVLVTAKHCSDLSVVMY